MTRRRILGAAVLAVVVLAPLGHDLPAGAAGSEAGAGAGYHGFAHPEALTILGYTGTAMEPFISADGQYLLFNTSNQAPNIPALQYATAATGGSFTYQGEIAGANQSGALSGTPTMDDDGNLYFVSTRSYAQTLSTIYTGQFDAGSVSAVHLVPGVSGATGGIVDFDVAVSPDGNTLYVSVGTFTGGSAPSKASLSIYDKEGTGFVADPASTHLLHAVNQKKSLTYAAAISTNGLELFFTRARTSGGNPAIYRATRKKISSPFGHVQRVAAITGFAEAPSISADGSTLYYHQLVGDQFDIESVTRPPTT